MSIIFKGTAYEAIRTHKLFFEGENQELNVYRIPLTELKYNIQNGRIGTYVHDYNINNPEYKLVDMIENNLEKYNDIISDYIIKSDNEKRFKATKDDIKQKTQQVSGVILDDGTIIDGNRRFTSLRKLHKEDSSGKFAYFETIIIERLKGSQAESRKKSIKILEIQLQHGTDEKVDYSPIQKLVDLYNNIASKDNEHALLLDEDYRNAAGMKVKEFSNLKQRSEIMVDFCKEMGIPEKFSIVEELKLDGPINEISNFKTKLTKAGKLDIYDLKYKMLIYPILLMSSEGDLTRDLRVLLNSYENESLDDLYDKNEKIIESIYEEISKAIPGDENLIIQTVRNSRESAELLHSFDESVRLEQLRKKRGKMASLITNAINQLNTVEVIEYKHMPEEEKKNIKKLMVELRETILNLNESFNND